MSVMKHATMALAIAILLGQSTAEAAAPVGTAFTYQGQLKLNGAPVNGTADMTFSLYDRDTGGVLLDSEALMQVPVTNGLFSVELLFERGDFNGDARWLEIYVRTREGDGILRPRQPIRPAPYALYALDSPAGTGGDPLWTLSGANIYYNAGNVGVGTTTPGSPLTVAGLIESTASGFKFPDGTTQTTAATSGSDSPWLTGHDLIYYNGGRVGIGTADPQAQLDVIGGIAMNGFHLRASRYTAGHVLTSDANGAGRWLALPQTADPLWGQTGDDIYYDAGKVGIGTVSPSYRLHLVTDQAYGAFFDSTAATGSAFGAYARAEGAAGAAVGTQHYGVYGSAKNAYSNVGVYGEASGGTNNFGGYFQGMLYASGSTGIGRPLPDAKLHVVQTGAADALRVEDQTDDTTPFVIDQSGSVGIGKATPTAKVHLEHTGIGDAFRVDDEAADTTPFIVTSDGEVGIGKATPTAKVHIEHTGIEDAFRVDDEAADTSPFIVTSDGEVGIGTENPAWPFVCTKDDWYVAMGYEHHTGLPFPSDEYHSLVVEYDNRASGYLGTHRDSALYGSRYYGVIGRAFSPGKNYAIYGEAGNGTVNYAGYFAGDVEVNGNLSKSAGSFKIDHPLDPENKYLQHSFVESPDMMNVYNGNVVLDRNGEAAVPMPDYFEALNRDFRYQLTAIGAPGPNLHVAAKIDRNQFRIAGGAAGMEVSWQVTGIRKDPYANANRIQVEVEKREADKTRYLHPDVYGFGRERGISELSAPKQVPEAKTAP